MKTAPKSPAVALGALVSLIGTSCLTAAVYNFGSGADGLAGFTQSPGSATEIWNTDTNSVQYRNQDPGTKNSSFLREIPLDRSIGSSYQIQGAVTNASGTVTAAGYTGDYFGFVTRARARNYVEGGPNTPEGRSL